jgi:DNA-binding MarR family transcriptional regulator
MAQLTQQDFEKLLEFRVTLRRFQRWSEDQARAAGLTHVQHQLLVAIKGHRGARPPTVGDLAGYLLLRPHSTVELVDRAEAAGLVERTPDAGDGRVVRVRLTGAGEEILQQLTRAHLDQLHDLAVVLDEFVTRQDDRGLACGRRHHHGARGRDDHDGVGEDQGRGVAARGVGAADHAGLEGELAAAAADRGDRGGGLDDVAGQHRGAELHVGVGREQALVAVGPDAHLGGDVAEQPEHVGPVHQVPAVVGVAVLHVPALGD